MAKDKSDRLAKLKEKLEKTDMGKSSAGFFTPKEGRNIIRILPEVGDMDFFFQEVGKHWLPDGSFLCPNFTSDDKLPCPMCEVVAQLYRVGTKPAKKLAGELRVARSYWMNVIDRDNEDGGPIVYTPGIQVFSSIAAAINDPDYGDITAIDDGIDVIIERTGEGRSTEYQVRMSRHDTALSDDEDKIEEWMAAARDLSYVELGMDPDTDEELADGHAVALLPYDRIVDEYDVDQFLDYDKESEPEEDVEEHPAKREVSRRRNQRTTRTRSR